MSTQIIKAFQKREGEPPEPGELYLNVSEFYCDTIQGEGIYTGCPAAFLRLTGEPYLFPELFRLMEATDLIGKFVIGHHLVITGGSPLLQQDQIVLFLAEFVNRYGFLPFIEIENECIFLPHSDLLDVVECWNNSPKLSSSGVKKRKRYKKSILQTMSSLSTSWFKFVIECEEDWEEIRMDFLEPGLIKRSQVILMPLGATRKELFENQEMVVEIAVKHGVRYCSREHIVLWDKNTGV